MRKKFRAILSLMLAFGSKIKTEKVCKPLERLPLHVIVAHELDDLLLRLAAVSVK